MDKLTDITIDVKANLHIDRRTAETCLRLVEIFCNNKRINVIANFDEDGHTTFEFEDRRKSKISSEALDALNVIGQNTHREE